MNAKMVTEDSPSNHPIRTEYPNVYIPVVPNGRACPVTGLKHALLYRQLIKGEAAKHVRVARLREPGASRGKMLFHVGDMLKWLNGLAAEQAHNRAAGGTCNASNP